MYTNLIKITAVESWDDYVVGDILEVSHIDKDGYMVLNTIQEFVWPHQSEPLTQQEVDDLFEPQAPKKHEFTYGQRVVIEESQQEYYCLGYTSEGRLITTRKPYDLEHVFTWCKLYSDDAQPYVPPKVKLTVERLNADYGVDAWELSSELGASE